MISLTQKVSTKNNIIATKFLASTSLESIINSIITCRGVIFTSYLIFLDIKESEMAVLFSFIGFTQMLQLFSTVIYHKYNNQKKIIYLFRFFRSFTIFLSAFIPVILEKQYYLPALIVLIILRFSLNNLIGGAYVEWNDYYISPNKKGKYYGLRNVLNNFQFIIFSFIIGKLLDNYSGEYLLYVFVFSSALIITMLDWLCVKDIDLPPKKQNKNIKVKDKILLPLKNLKYRKFLLFSFIWMMALGLGRPMLTVYSVKYLNYSYNTIAITNSLSSFIKLFAGIVFGIMIDKLGAKFIIIICSLGFGIMTLLHIFMSPNKVWFYIIIIIVNGIFMIGFNVSKFNFNLNLSKGTYMNEYLSMNTAIMGLSTFISTGISGIAIKLLNDVSINVTKYQLNSYQILFLLSGILHIVALFYFLINFIPRKEEKNERVQSSSLGKRLGYSRNNS